MGLTADIGSGGHPQPGCDVYVDRWPDEARERMKSTERVVVPEGAHFVVADIEALPFVDDAFDHVSACEILEHVESPTEACRELSRVARAGRVTTPSAFSEIFFGWRYHRWLVMERGGRLWFFRKRPEEQLPFGGYFKRQLGKKPGHVVTPEIHKARTERPGCFQIDIEWEESIMAVEISDAYVRY